MIEAIHHPAMPEIAALDSSGGTSGTSAASGSSNTNDTSITANDFLTLLVAEMKNQDPTADTDPNAYIDQLVQVNSLQQLIQINQDLGSSSASGPSSGPTSSSTSGANTPAHAMSAASRLATSLESAQAMGHNAVDAGHALPGAVQTFKTSIHQP